nr:hypothetical protein [Candidatus Babeliales bacterium]
MHLIDFCKNYTQIFSKQPSVIIFESKKYAPVAFAQIIGWLEQINVVHDVQRLNLDQDLEQIKMILQTTFLGQSQQFIFHDVSILAKKKRSEFLQFLQYYQGPHQIIGWIGHQDDMQLVDTDHLIKIVVADMYTQDVVHGLLFLYHDQKRESIAYFFARLFRIRKELSLDQICLLHGYARLIGKNIDIFFQEWFDQLIMDDVSLFFVAQLFFEKKPDAFFKHWHWIRPYFSDQFWVTFFSDQIFKAYLYVRMHGQVPQAQKQLVYG